ncbi:hypothetical protein H2200_008898 [Cladophialophora chaetospira]|uniref:Uncharacterized protein n=1 Tax=Cladophialophora chaetospira TaxID=386627 RepID=A0AA38X4Y7_9EURO|nr:hypothetical protein H2200_008898 [Cladophialophora chaetospira]
MSAQGSSAQPNGQEEELDEWDQRIFSTGCADEQLRMNDCYYDKKDWRACKTEVGVEPQPQLIKVAFSALVLGEEKVS